MLHFLDLPGPSPGVRGANNELCKGIAPGGRRRHDELFSPVPLSVFRVSVPGFFPATPGREAGTGRFLFAVFPALTASCC